MHKFLPALFLLLIISCQSKRLTKDERARSLIDSAIVKNLDDPGSYQSVGFTTLAGIKNGGYYIGHKFRAKNKFGALVLQEECFFVDSAFKDVSCCFRGCPVVR